MRVTESRLFQVGQAGVTAARDRVADAGRAFSGGMRVEKPSDDPRAWAEGQRAQSRRVLSEERGQAAERAHERLVETDAALDAVGAPLARIRELTVQMSNGSYDASARASAAKEVRELRSAMIAAANRKGSDGSYLFAGSAGDLPAFDANGAYQGDTEVLAVETDEGLVQQIGIPGSVLTAANGVDVFAMLDNLATAFENNDVAGMRAGLPELDGAISQIAEARSDGGSYMASIDQAMQARELFELNLAEVRARSVEADPVEAATALAQASQALEAARAAAEQLFAAARNSIRG